jgi:hypothetical protein
VPFYLYKRTPRDDGSTTYTQVDTVSLAGTTNGLVYPFVRAYARAGAETFPWHATIRDLLAESGLPSRNHTVVVDVNPKQDVTLFELTDVLGFSYLDTTPICLRMQALFLGEKPLDPERFKERFSDARCSRRPVHQFLYLQGGLTEGDWRWGPVGSVNGALLWPDALEFFLAMLGEEDDDT